MHDRLLAILGTLMLVRIVRDEEDLADSYILVSEDQPSQLAQLVVEFAA